MLIIHKSRRERGVIAQRAYRKRHASKFQALKEENERLRHAIARVGIVAAGEGRFNSDLDSVISDAKNVAKAGEEGLETGNQNDAGTTATTTVRGECPNGKEASPTAQNVSKTWSSTPGFRNIPTSSGVFVDGNMGMRSFAMPSNCITYLGDASTDSLAGGIYRAVLSIAIRRWHTHFQQQNPPPVLPDQPLPVTHTNTALYALPATRSSPLDIAFPLLHPLENDDLVPQCIFSRPPSEQPSDSSPTCAHDVVKRCRINEPEGWWRAADGLETFLRQQALPPEALAIFEEVMRGGGSEKHIEDVKAMLEALARNYKCFGDGPRWNAVYVTVAMDMFRKDIMDEE